MEIYFPKTLFVNLRHPDLCTAQHEKFRVPTWVIEGHQDVLRGLILSPLFAVDDFEHHFSGFIDVVRHAAGGVDYKD